jgi:hypothetical protein
MIMIVLHSVEDYALYPRVVISSPFGTSFGVRSGDHYILFTKVPLGQSCILLRFPHLRPLMHQADPRYSHTLPCCSRIRHIPKVP